MRNLAAVLLLAFAFLGILQGLLHGYIGLMARQVVVKLPLAVLGMVVTVAAVGTLLDLTDALAAAIAGAAGRMFVISCSWRRGRTGHELIARAVVEVCDRRGGRQVAAGALGQESV